MTAVLAPDVAVEALFASNLQQSQHPTRETVQAAVDDMVARLGVDGCAAVMATEFGEHPECACQRMRWARTLVGAVAR